MRFNFPKNDEKYHWTDHVKRKMVFYGLSADRIKRVLRNPKRSEMGVAPNTIAVMQPAGISKRPSEIWVMYQELTRKTDSAAKQRETRNKKSKYSSLGRLSPGSPRKRIIITAWRYPGISPVRKEIPIPADILEELKKEGLVDSI